jgi:lambda repressor-like predicted transcriptional regulator
MPEYRRRQPRTMNDQVRAEVIMDLRRKGWTYKAIGRRVGLSPNGVKYALHRVTQPGRYTEVCEEEVDHGEAPEAW